MTQKRGEVLIPLSSLAKTNKLELSYLQKQCRLKKLSHEKRGRYYFSNQDKLDSFSSFFKFDKYLLKKNFIPEDKDFHPEKKIKTISKITKPNSNKKEIVKKNDHQIKKSSPRFTQEKWDIDIEHALVKKWNKEFKEIHSEFISFLNTQPKHLKIKKSKKVKLSSKNHVHETAIILSVAFFLALYSVIVTPGLSKDFSAQIDSAFKASFNKVSNSLLVFYNMDNNLSKTSPAIKTPKQEVLSAFIKNKITGLSLSKQKTLAVSEAELYGRVAGIDEYFETKEKGIFKKMSRSLKDAFYLVAEKQKRTSQNINKKLKKIISKS